MKISETCTCGAKCEVEMQSASAAAHYIKTWRTEHAHYVRNLPYYGSGTYPTPNGGWTVTNVSDVA
jgi:hypothetical protein